MKPFAPQLETVNSRRLNYDPTLELLRWRDPQSDRFASMDNFEGDPSDPSTLNKYVYCRSDPINLTDPSGHFGIPDSVYDLVAEVEQRSQFEASLAMAIGGNELNNVVDIELLAAATQPTSRPEDIYLDLIERHEGRRYGMYVDSAGKRTIGVGFNLDRAGAATAISNLLSGITRNGLIGGATLGDDQINTLLRNDVVAAIDSARGQLPNFDDLAPDARKVVVDMIFNLGSGGFSNFPQLKAALGRKDYNRAAQEMINSRWYGQTGNRAKDDVDLMQNAAGQ